MATYDLRDVYVIPCNVYGLADFFGPAKALGSVTVESNQFEIGSPGLWGVFASGATRLAGNLELWESGNLVTGSSCELWFDTHGPSNLNGRFITLGLIYSGADRNAPAPNPYGGFLGDGYLRVATTYSDGVAPQIFWAISGFAPAAPGAFWTNLVLTREEGIEAIKTPQSAKAVSSLPYQEVLGEFAETVHWYKVSLSSSGTYVLHTKDSPSAVDHDTYLALFDAKGVLIDSNEDVDVESGDYRSSITASLDADVYYIALGAFGTTASDGFKVVPGTTYQVPAGVILKIRAA